MIQIWLSGGPATIDIWDLKPEAPEEIRGEFRPIETAVPGVSITEHMPRLASVMDHCALVRSLGHTITAHGPGTTYMATGNRPSPALDYPSMGSLAARVLPARQGVPPYVTFAALREGVAGAGPGYLGPAYGPFEVEGEPVFGEFQAHGVSLPSGFSPAELESREALRRRFDRGLRALESTDTLAGLDRFHRQALEVLHSDRVRSALDLAREPDVLRNDYGRSPLGQGALAARRLIEAGARFVTLGVGGWDTHGDNFRTLRDRLLPPLDRALAALIRDLNSRGLLDETIIMCAGEFARTPRVNGTAGRDHWARSMAVLLGRRRHSREVPSSARPMSGEWPPAETPARRTIWLPRSSGGSVSALAMKSGRPVGGQSRSSARGAAWSPCRGERLSKTSTRVSTMTDAPPSDEIARILTGYWSSQAVYVAAELGIADRLANGSKTTEELAEATRTSPPVAVPSAPCPGQFGGLHRRVRMVGSR